ncbi:BTB domain-containing protein [Mycena sanguinolenta]|uniref:BTB domain-containing protein n=1 Tax=Mycena sanguinolenta TaxID=230812 RepID=A0A8H7DFN5_9AGAR|nr:BTB domain-containing protein [Mycena sanguinolenta]
MFSLPQSGAGDEVPVIPVTETGRLFDRFLRVWYPGAEMLVKFDGLDELAKITELALLKYDVQSVAPIMRIHSQVYLQTHCLGVFAVACRYGWDDVAKAATKQSLNFTRATLFNDSTLLRYHHTCGRAASSVKLLGVSDHRYSWYTCTSCPAHTSSYSPPPFGMNTPRAWIFQYLDEMSSKLKDTPGANVQDPSILLAAQVKAASCKGNCRQDGLRDLIRFVTEKYEPAVKAAIEAVRLEISF